MVIKRVKKIYIAIDNGVSGSIGKLGEGENHFSKVPTKVQQDYTKKKANVTRIDFAKMMELLKELTEGYESQDIMVGVERPMVNPTRFVATASALRAWESTLIILEELELPYTVIDSKAWQKELLPQGVKGSAELKKASMDVGNRLFPHFQTVKHPDRDGILMAEYLKRNF